MTGFRVIGVSCDAKGNIDLSDLTVKAERHRDQLAALMVTYPSTHGVFEEDICKICEVIHHHGGQVYLDGANLNSVVGLCRPGDFGADVCQLNLHKTLPCRTAAVGVAWDRLGLRHTLRRTSRTPAAWGNEPWPIRAGKRSAVCQRKHPSHQLDVHRHDGP